MNFQQVVVNIVIPVLAAGILTPLVLRWILKWQRQKQKRLIKDNGRMDLIDELSARAKKSK